MSDRTRVHPARLRAALFVTCAACTLWLMVQNTILFTLLPWDRLAPAFAAPEPILRAAIAGIAQLSLVPIAFALGWLVSRQSARAAESRERVHE